MGGAKAFIAGFGEGLDGDRCYRSGHGCQVLYDWDGEKKKDLESAVLL